MSDPGTEEGGFDEPTAPAWMATFGDLMSLLLTFFVLLMSFASMDVRKFAAITGSMRDAFGVQTVHAGLVESLSDSVVKLSETEATPMLRVVDLPRSLVEREQSLLERLRRAIEARELQRVVVAEPSPRGVVLRMGDRLLFDAGSAELRPEAVVLLREIARLIGGVPGPVSVEGHTDSTRPAAGSEAASPATEASLAAAASASGSNWELSARRAVAVVRQLAEAEGIPPQRLRATAFGDTRPVASNADAEGRAANRRVEFVFLRSEIDLDADVWIGTGAEAAARAAVRSEGDES